MKVFLKQIYTASLALFLVAAILAPSALKLSHALYEHHELVCSDDSISHVHEIEFDCEFLKFNLSPQIDMEAVEIAEISEEYFTKNYYNYYTFLSNFQKLPFALRGPPSFLA